LFYLGEFTFFEFADVSLMSVHRGYLALFPLLEERGTSFSYSFFLPSGRGAMTSPVSLDHELVRTLPDALFFSSGLFEARRGIHPPFTIRLL